MTSTGLIYSSTHVIALLKGAVEGNPRKHFGSILGWSGPAGHLAIAIQVGLVIERPYDEDDEDEQIIATDLGRRFYAAHGLADLPDGRANYWQERLPRTAVDALAVLAQQVREAS